MENYSKEIITIRFDKEMFGEFTGIRPSHRQEDEESWFKLHPRARHLPMHYLGKKRTGVLPSLNNVLNVPDRRVQNERKQQFSDYTEFCINKQKVPRAFLKQCIIIVKHVHGTKTHFDVDNVYIKPTLDCLVKMEVLQEDNYNVLKNVTLCGFYEKNNDHSELYILPIYEEYSYEFVMDYANNIIKGWETYYGKNN